VTPADARIEIARLRAVISNDGATFFSSGLRLSGAETPTIDTDNADLAESAQSAVRISGISYACGQVKTATGFVVADERVVTNAHVVAGSKRPAIEALNGQVLIGTVVYFNAQDDLAVIAVPGLAVAPLKMGITARADTPAAFEGFPFGGPLSVQAAHIERVGTISSPNIYDSGGSAREVYIFAGDVNHGDSGGPLLSLKGDVIGVIFARSSAQENVGYAMTQTELKPVVDIAKTLTSKVSSGACIFD
jgi:S1-C subfamily serine protease